MQFLISPFSGVVCIYFICGALSVKHLGCILAPPQPNVTWESYETSVTVTLHTPSYLFDDWKLEIFSFFNGTFRGYY